MSQGFTGTRFARSGIWTEYTPAWSSSGTQPSLGNGTLTGRYTQTGKTVTGIVEWQAGSTTTYGTGNWLFSVPVTARFADWLYTVGAVFGEDAGVSGFNGVAALNSSTVMIFYSPGTNATAWTNTYPTAWGNADRLRISFTYEAA
jgi:hypothetical protein